VVDDTSYTYTPSGNPLSVTDKQSETGSTVTGTQCFAYNTLDELTTAWTATDACANQNPTASGNKVSTGAQAYLETFGYDSAGDRTSEEDYGITGSSTTTTTTDTYTNGGTPASTCSNTAVQPHTLTSVKAVTGSTTVTTGFCYDKSGNMLSRTPSSGSGAQTLTWNDAGQVASITEGGKTTSFVYSADGSELIRRDPGQTTFFAGDTEIMVSTSSSTWTLAGAVRYYTLGGSGSPVAGEQSLKPGASSEFYELDTPQGTATMTMDAVTQVVSRQEYSPYGKLIYTGGSWPDSSRGYLGQPAEPSAQGGYDDLGARKYDPTLGRFISADPVLETTSPQQLGGYTYAGDNPVGGSDPGGLEVCADDGPCGSVKAVEQYTANVEANEAAQAEAQQIDDCGWHGGCVMTTIRAYSSPSYAVTQGLEWEAAQEYKAAIADQQAAEEAAAQAAAAARAQSSGGFWGSVAGVLDQASSIMNTVALATCWIPGVDEVTAAAAVSLDVADGLVNAGIDFSQGDYLSGAEALGGAGLDAVTGGLGGDAAAAEDDAESSVEQAVTSCGLSFAPQTRVLLASGASAAISSLKPGDKVLATNTKTGKTSPEAVAAVLVNHDTDLYDLKVKTAKGTAVIHTTSNHPFWDPAAHRWVQAGKLRPGEPLLTANGTTATADGGTTPKDHSAWMWDLTIPGNGDHDFYVDVAPDMAGANESGNSAPGSLSVLVHNCSKTLGRNLGKSPAGMIDPEAHHILPQGFKAITAPARAIFAKYGIGMDDAENGVWLSHATHRGTFGKTYTQWVTDGIVQADSAAGQAGVLDFLTNTRSTLQDLEGFYGNATW
jgi:RHS repeat-associated protein